MAVWNTVPGLYQASQVELGVKNPPANAGDIRDVSLIPGSGRSPGGGNGTPLQFYCLENPMDRGAWQATAHGVAQSRARLSDFTLINFYSSHISISRPFKQTNKKLLAVIPNWSSSFKS